MSGLWTLPVSKLFLSPASCILSPWRKGWARVESILGLIFHCHSCEKGFVSAKAFSPIFSLASLGPNIFKQSSALGGN